MAMTEKQRIAVLFGGRSPEHDVSIVTGLQALQAIDSARYQAFPVYIDPHGEWLIGEALAERSSYLPDAGLMAQLTAVTPDICGNKGALLPRNPRRFRRPAPIRFEVAVLAFHGTTGEDGQIQGLFETANVPYTGMRTLACAVLMDKAATKRLLQSAGIPMLAHVVLERPRHGLMLAHEALEAATRSTRFPAIAKPNHLGSSIGVAKVADVSELAEVLPQIFKLDPIVILEPYVDSLVEYNVAVCGFGGRLRTSAIEQPKRVEDLLDFKQKYLAGGSKKVGSKQPGQLSQGMLSLTRDLNPTLPPEMERNIRRWAERAFLAVAGTGAPRVDFLSNATTGELWLNEINPCPGSLGFFLWEAYQPPLLFTQLLSELIEEALACHRRSHVSGDPVPEQARLFRRPQG
jgi:D-alanine-D-alanine ligase